MKRDPALVRLSEEHHHGLVFSLLLERELPGAADDKVAELYAALLRFWARGLLPHFTTEGDCLLARLVRHVPLDEPNIDRVQREHFDIAVLVARMRDATDIEERRRALAEFGAALRSHIRWEEREWFESVQELLTDEELAAAGREILERHAKPTQAPWE